MLQSTTPNDWYQELINRLESMDQKLGALTKIEHSVGELKTRMGDMETKFVNLEGSVDFVSGKYDEQIETNNTLKKQIDNLSKQVNGNICDKSPRAAIRALTESVVDIKTRSMRDNLLFKGIPECNGDNEDCESLV